MLAVIPALSCRRPPGGVKGGSSYQQGVEESGSQDLPIRALKFFGLLGC